MKEIIGENLQSLFRRMGIYPPKKFAGNVARWMNLEVWHLTDSQYNLVKDITDEEFSNMVIEKCWFRIPDGSIMGTPETKFIINGKELLAWIHPSVLHNLEIEYEELPWEEKIDYKNLEEYISFWHPLEYDGLLEYYIGELRTLEVEDVCALSVDLAKHNNITVAELFYKYCNCTKVTYRGV